jgi:Tfp pilus assembly protein PilX
MADTKKKSITGNEDGFVLVLAMLIMVVLIIIGVSSIRTSQTELEIAGNERVHKQTFYDAEAGIPIGIETIWINYDDNNTGFAVTGTDVFGDNVTDLGDNVTAVSQNPWQNSGGITCPTDANRDIYYPYYTENDNPLQPHTNIRINGRTVYGEGSALQMAAGYEGIGKGSAGGGSHKLYDIYSQRHGYRDSESNVQAQWRFVP